MDRHVLTDVNEAKTAKNQVFKWKLILKIVTQF